MNAGAGGAAETAANQNADKLPSMAFNRRAFSRHGNLPSELIRSVRLLVWPGKLAGATDTNKHERDSRPGIGAKSN